MAALGNLLSTVRQPTDEPPSPTELAHCEHQFVLSLLQRKVHRIVFRIHNAEETGVAKALCAASAVKDLSVQEDAHLVAVSDLKFSHLIADRLDACLRVDHFHARLRLKALRKIALKRHAT